MWLRIDRDTTLERQTEGIKPVELRESFGEVTEPLYPANILSAHGISSRFQYTRAYPYGPTRQII